MQENSNASAYSVGPPRNFGPFRAIPLNCYFLQAVQACRRNVAAGGNPGGLVGKADRVIAELTDKAEADDCAGEHLCHSGEKCSSGISESLRHHSGDV